MITEIVEIQKFFSKMSWAIDLFMQGVDNPSNLTIENYNSSVFTKQIGSIETIWKNCVSYVSQQVCENPYLSSSFSSQFGLFHQSTLDKHYKNFVRTTSKDKLEEIQDRTLREDFDLNEAKCYALHEDYKGVLFDLLKMFESEVDFVTKQAALSDEKTKGFLDRENKNKAEVKQKILPSTFAEIFNIENWEKYIDALVHVQLLDTDHNFVGNPNKHKGVIASWFYSLQGDFKVIKAGVSRSVFKRVVNQEIPNLRIGSDKSFEQYSKLYETKFKRQLEDYIENIPTLPRK